MNKNNITLRPETENRDSLEKRQKMILEQLTFANPIDFYILDESFHTNKHAGNGAFGGYEWWKQNLLGTENSALFCKGDKKKETGAILLGFATLMFGMDIKDGNKSVFAGGAFEFMKAKGPGKMGHIAIKTNFVDRAMVYLKRLGFEFDESTITYDEKSGRPKFVYFKDEICGFAVHLIQK